MSVLFALMHIKNLIVLMIDSGARTDRRIADHFPA